MKQKAIVVAFVLGAGAEAWAGTWCDNFTDPVFCDSFDTYCIGPNNPCTVDSTPSIPMLKSVWDRTSVNYHVALNPDGTLKECGAILGLEVNQTILNSEPYGARNNNMGDENGDLGQQMAVLIPGIQAKFGWQYNVVLGTDSENLYLRFNMTGGLRSASGLDLSHGYFELSLEDQPHKKSEYLDPEVAPTDFIMVGGLETGDCLSCFGLCQQLGATNGGGVHTAWPTICASYDARTASSLCPDPNNPSGPPIPCGPPYCPVVPEDKIHASLAIGALAMLDPNPCHCEFGPPAPPRPVYYNQGMKNAHLALFDGWKWRSLREGDYGDGATGTGDFLLGDKSDTVELWIKTTTMDVHHVSRQWIPGPDPYKPDAGGHWEPDVHSYAYDIPRKYLGGFNVIRSGTSPGCKLKPDTYDCETWAGTKCHNMTGSSCLGGGVDDGSNYVSMDSLVLLGGEGSIHLSTGACCLPDLSCTEVLQPDCVAQGGMWTQANQTCATTLCCPHPFADHDVDQDVDMDDFAVLQRCLTNGGGSISQDASLRCACFDVAGVSGGPDGSLDWQDVEEFVLCGSGTGVDWVPTPDCP